MSFRMEADLRAGIAKVLERSPLGVLATCGPDGAHTSLVGMAFTEGLDRAMFVTTRTSRKYTDLVTTPRVSILMDDRRNEVTDFRDASAVSVSGMAREAMGDECDLLGAIYLERHPHLKDFLAAPTTALVVVDVRRLSMVTRFQKVMEMVLDG